MRRKSDPRWEEVRKKVWERDGGCRLLKVLNLQEVYLLSRVRSIDLGVLDVAHVFPVSKYPWMVYDLDNVVLLNRWSHRQLDGFRHPVTGEWIGVEGVEFWWRKIVGSTNYEMLKERAYNPGFGNEEADHGGRW